MGVHDNSGALVFEKKKKMAASRTTNREICVLRVPLNLNNERQDALLTC